MQLPSTLMCNKSALEHQQDKPSLKQDSCQPIRAEDVPKCWGWKNPKLRSKSCQRGTMPRVNVLRESTKKLRCRFANLNLTLTAKRDGGIEEKLAPYPVPARNPDAPSLHSAIFMTTLVV